MDFWEFAKALSRDEGKRLTGELNRELLELDEQYECADCTIKGTETCITQCGEEKGK